MATKKKDIDTRTKAGKAIRGPRLISRGLVQQGLRDRIDGEMLIDRLTGLTINLAQTHDAGESLSHSEISSLKLESQLLLDQLKFVLPQLAAVRVESDMKEGNIIESGVVMLPELDEELTEEQRGTGKKALENKDKREE